MTQNDDIRKAKRGAVISSDGKTKVTIYLDDDVIEHFRNQANASGRGFQTEINGELRKAMRFEPKP